MRRVALAVALFALPAVAHADFDWGQDCEDGSGAFTQYVSYGAIDEVGNIPDDRRDVFVHMDGDGDVDVQLVDVETGTEIIAWPNGILSGPEPDCTWWQGIRVCYSGYNGDGTLEGLGREWIRINGRTQRQLQMRVYGYIAGNAEVTYSYRALPTCNEVGDGTFTQFIPQDGTVGVGEIAAGKTNIDITLEAGSGRDVDVQVWDGATPVVSWPSGLLNGPTEESVEYAGAKITYSGYNGIDGNWGDERIQITGTLNRPLTMKAYGYQWGLAEVDYRWGVGVGATCGGIATLSCADGLSCKAWQRGVSDPAGQCHTETWCRSPETANEDCSNLPHVMAVGYWDCQQYECNYQIGYSDVCADADRHYVSEDPGQCASIRYDCEPGMVGFGDACGCGCECPAVIDCEPGGDAACDIPTLSEMCPSSVFAM